MVVTLASVLAETEVGLYVARLVVAVVAMLVVAAWWQEGSV